MGKFIGAYLAPRGAVVLKVFDAANPGILVALEDVYDLYFDGLPHVHSVSVQTDGHWTELYMQHPSNWKHCIPVHKLSKRLQALYWEVMLTYD